MLKTAEAFFDSFRAGEYTAATRAFDARLESALPAERLAATGRRLAEVYGPLRSFRLTRKLMAAAGKQRFEYELRFARGSMTGLLAFEVETERMIGVFFVRRRSYRPDPSPGVADKIASIDMIVSGDLNATLAVPKNLGPGPFPALLLVPGSGPQDRDETLGEIRPFRDLAEGLATRGIVTLRFDKRTFAQPSAFAHGEFTVEQEFVRDAIAALGVLASRPEVNKARLFVLGHSLGALLAPEIAHRAGQAAGIVMVAAPGRPVLAVLADQLRSAGAPAAVIEKVEADARAIDAHVPSPETRMQGAPAAYWYDLASRDAFAVARLFDGPILFVRGDADHNVTAADQAIWVQALADRPAVRATVLPGLTHLLVPQDAIRAPAGAAAAARVPDTLIDMIASFVVGATAHSEP